MAGEDIMLSSSLRLASERSKLVVRYQSALLDGQFLHSGEYRSSLLGFDGNAEFLGFQIDAVQPALLPEDDAPVSMHQVGRVRLDRFGNVKLAGHRSAFAH